MKKVLIALTLVFVASTAAEAGRARPGTPSPQQAAALATINAAKAQGATTTVVGTVSGSQVTITYKDGSTQVVNLN